MPPRRQNRGNSSRGGFSIPPPAFAQLLSQLITERRDRNEPSRPTRTNRRYSQVRPSARPPPRARTGLQYDEYLSVTEPLNPPGWLTPEEKMRWDEYLCPLSLDLMWDPVIADDGHTYERDQLDEALRVNGNKSPTTGQPMLANFVANIHLRKAIDAHIRWRLSVLTTGWRCSYCKVTQNTSDYCRGCNLKRGVYPDDKSINPSQPEVDDGIPGTADGRVIKLIFDADEPEEARRFISVATRSVLEKLASDDERVVKSYRLDMIEPWKYRLILKHLLLSDGSLNRKG